MVRKLKWQEQKLLKKVDFIKWSKKEDKSREIINRYGIKREDYTVYHNIIKKILNLQDKLAKLDPKDPVRIKTTDGLLEKLFNMGLIDSQRSLIALRLLSTETFCRRRLAFIMVRTKMVQSIREGITFVEQGRIFTFASHPLALKSHLIAWLSQRTSFIYEFYLISIDVRVGPKIVTDPAFLVTRNMEDFVTWADHSKIRKKVLKFNNLLDDYDLL